MYTKPLPSQTKLQELYSWDEELGRFRWRSHPCKNQRWRIGSPAGTRHSEGGWVIQGYLQSRLCWMYHYGVDPGQLEVDHIDEDRSNDRTDNLRLATREEQQANVSVGSRNTSGIKGVSFYKRLNKWRADIHISGAQKTLGYFTEISDAIEARLQAEQDFQGEFASAS